MQKIIRTGNSAAVTLPAELMRTLNLRFSDPVEVKINYLQGEITFRFPSARQLPLTTSKRKSQPEADPPLPVRQAGLAEK